MSCLLLFSLFLLVEAACIVWAIDVTVPTEGETYSLNPGSSLIQWEQQSGDPSECDIWLQKEDGGQATYFHFAHVEVSACQLDFSSWPASLMNESRSLIPGEYCFTFTTTASSAEQGTFLAQSADFVIQDKESSKGLSTGARVGIGVGVGLAGLAFLCLCGYIVMRRKRRCKRPGETQAPSYSKPELEDNQVAKSPLSTAKPELSASAEKVGLSELASSASMIHELPGSNHQPYEAGTSTDHGTAFGSSDRTF
ncbi:uncharacterized protein PV07_00628 [Cladophialophora immunda]|uniref:GOLD domain-containing protein n=1 Tax=Cladophialophora immunda TaxID=569365 RepID=A0A0D2B844_9EURO|nr:uncharacterized protein PV07_00628 [Cladophialophora immunda]KIW33807.1 hypothetical protein PV07_00628 [Cladophialophora immunda]OQU94317.1 hypothetical protein CLAIMM_00683 [Cladophialophora immunda]